MGQDGQLQVGVAGGVAVAGEVLGAAEHPLGLGGGDEGGRQAPRRGGILPQARTLITGLAGLLFTSQTGARTQFRPSRRAWRPVQRP